MKYRTEIDGLRAVAVLPVILFHAGFEVFSGGFLGVDIFFVISGYLITSIIIADLDDNKFSIVDFYERRARRILPALFFVLIVCIPIAWLWMLPNQMKGFSQSLVAVSLFSSNILFWRTSGYFDTSAEEKPLLHTWSLAVEEQYYLFFPLFLILTWRLGKNRIFWLIVVTGLLSLTLCEWAWRNQPTANFYLAPTRAWELLAGSLSAFLVYKNGVQKSEFLASLGLGLTIFAIFSFDENTPFPSTYTLVPVLGVVLIILYATTETYVAKFLSIKTFVTIGLLSYSAYLWHQPLFAFAKIRLVVPPSGFLMGVLSILSLILAYFSWKFIEAPFRRKDAFTRKRIFQLSSFGIVFFIVLGTTGYKYDGFKNLMLSIKYSDKEKVDMERAFSAMDYNMFSEMAVSDCMIWVRNPNEIDMVKYNNCKREFGKSLVVLGDSHAMNLFNIFSYSKAYPFVLGISQPGCRPHSDKSNCHYDSFNEFAKKNSDTIDLVAYHQSGSYFIKDHRNKVDSQSAFEGKFLTYERDNIIAVKRYLNSLNESTKLNVVWIGPFLEFRRTFKDQIFEDAIYDVNPESVRLFKGLEDALQNSLTESANFNYIKFGDIFLEPNYSFYNNCFVFRDADHYSKCGEKIIAQSVGMKFLDKYIAN